MKAFNRILAAVLVAVLAVFAVVNVMLFSEENNEGRPYRVEVSRLAAVIEKSGLETVDITACQYVTGVAKYSENFYNTDSDYIVREINGELYRFDYKADNTSRKKYIIAVNSGLLAMSAVIICVLIYIRQKILKPFNRLTDVPYELSKGNLVTPVEESKNRFFGKFLWGVDMLRENMEQQKKRELKLQKDKKMLLLSLSHDIKTPLSAIKLYSAALSRGLYTEKEKQLEIAENINHKADEIESYVTQIIEASREDFLSLEVLNSEFYLSELIETVRLYYDEKLSLKHIVFTVDEYSNCILKGDLNRSVEVLQNIIENALKYGDGKEISVAFSEEEGCKLISVTNSGCSLSENDMPHIFDSFWRGENAANIDGSGLGLYICRQLMHKMNGDVFGKINGDNITVTAVFGKA